MTVRFLIAGAVQGVGFRWFVARHARGLDLTGYARNLPDGRVEVVARGPDAARLERLEALLRSGPAGARVVQVEREDLADERTVPSRSFDIR
ncbi:MAG: acylphosphatase [Gemmatimonadales bacterium]